MFGRRDLFPGYPSIPPSAFVTDWGFGIEQAETVTLLWYGGRVGPWIQRSFN